MKKLTTLTLSIGFTFLLQSMCFAQIALPGGFKVPSKEEKRAKQIEKSDAKEQILFVEREISRLQQSFKSGDWEKRDRDMKEKKDYDEAELKIKNIDEAILQIKSKDPKWAEKNDYSADVSGLKSSLASKVEGYKEVGKKKEDQAFFNTKYYEIDKMTRNGSKDFYDAKKFSDYMLVTFNYNGTKKRINELLTTYPEFKDEYYYQFVKKFYEKDFPVFADKDLPAHIEKLKTEAAEGFERGPLGSKNKLNDAITFCKIMMEISPERTQYKQMIPPMEELLVKFDKYMDEKIYTSAMHKKYVGQVLFSHKPIVPGKEKEEDFKTSFKAGEPVYAICYFGYATKTYIDFSFYINNTKAVVGSFMDRALYSTAEIPSATLYTFMVIPDAAYLKTKTVKGGGAYAAFKIMDELAGTISRKGAFADKKFELELHAGGTYSFTYDASENAAAMQQAYDAVKKIRIDDLRLPKSKGSNPEIVSAFNVALSEFGQVQKVVLSEPAWTFIKNKFTGIIMSREGYGYAVVKDKNGKCYMYGCTVSQQKGGSVFGKAELTKLYEDFENVDGNQYTEDLDGKKEPDGYKHGFEFNCANINK